MSEPCEAQMMGEFREQVDIECGEYYLNEFGRAPTEEELELFFEDYLDSDYRRGEE